MRTRLKLALTALVAMVAVALLSLFLGWMNRPSDLWFWLGAVSAVAVFVMAPAAIAVIWRRKDRAENFGQGRTI